MSLRTWLIVLLYAAFSLLWVSIAGYLISLTLEDPLLRHRAYLAKELILIAISSMLFYILLKTGRESNPATLLDAGSRFGRFRLNRLMLMFFSLAMIVPLVGIIIVKVYSPEVERNAYADLQTIVDLKAEQIELWLDERKGDAAALAESEALIERVSNLARNGDEKLAQSIHRRLEAIRHAYSYESVLLLNARGESLLVLGKQQKLPPATWALLARASKHRRIQSTDFFLDEQGAPRLDIVVALVPEAPGNEPAGLVVMRADLKQFLLPLIEKWPGHSPSAETLLIRTQGRTVSYLNTWRHAPEIPASQRWIEGENKAALLASAKEGPGAIHGIDYRGEPVFASSRAIAGTDWRLYAKIDQHEVFMQLWTLVFWISVVVLIAIAVVSMVLLQLWRQQQRAHELALIVRTAEQDRLLKYFYELPFIGMAITSSDQKHWLRFNDQLCKMLGYTHEELGAKTWRELTHSEDVERDIREHKRVMRGEIEGYALNKRFIRKDSSIMLANVDIKCVRANDATVACFVAMIRDITEQEQRKREVLATQRQLQATLDALPDLLFELDLEGCCHAYHSARAGLPACILTPLGRKVSEILPPDATEIVLSALMEAREKGRSVGKQVELRLPGEDSAPWFELSVSCKQLDPGLEPRFIVLARDITERKVSEQHILNLAHYDMLTGLPNRALLADRMKVAIHRAARSSARLAVLFADLDRFKAINDSLGHEVGDQLLKAAAERMRKAVRGVDTVSRVGGDEFVVLLSEIETAEDAARVAEKLIFALSQPYHIAEHELLLTASVGICLYPDNGSEPGVLLRNSDASMYSAKESGRNRYQFYSEDMTVRAIERLSLEHDLRGAVERGEMLLVYQPQIKMGTGRLIGAEVLMRWQHPARGLIMPLRFIPVAEDTGLILGMGEWALRESCRQAKTWRDRGYPDICIAVNVSAVQFRQSDFVNIVARALEESGLPPGNLEMELTESVILQDIEPALQKFRELNSLGVKVAIDDFGTGYSSLSRLRQFTVDRLKIDQSFIRDLPGNPDAEAIAAAIVAMGLRLDLRIIAEGVETEAQARFLQSILCEEGQGYLYAWPMTAPEFAAWMSEWQKRINDKCDKC